MREDTVGLYYWDTVYMITVYLNVTDRQTDNFWQQYRAINMRIEQMKFWNLVQAKLNIRPTTICTLNYYEWWLLGITVELWLNISPVTYYNHLYFNIIR